MGLLDFLFTGVIAHFLTKKHRHSGHKDVHDEGHKAYHDAHEYREDYDDYHHRNRIYDDAPMDHDAYSLDSYEDHNEYEEYEDFDHDDYGEHDLDGWYGDESFP